MQETILRSKEVAKKAWQVSRAGSPGITSFGTQGVILIVEEIHHVIDEPCFINTDDLMFDTGKAFVEMKQ